MRINPFTQNLTNYKMKRQVNHLAGAPAVCPHSSPSFMGSIKAFTSLPIKASVKNVSLPSLLQEMDAEIYGIMLFDKIRKQKVNAFLAYTANKSIKYLNVFDKNGEIIGSTNINFSDWKSNDLPKNYLRLHDLESIGKEKYKGIGSTIIQAAVEQSLKTDAEGRIYVYAYNVSSRRNDPFVFYNKMGLSLLDPDGHFGNLSEYIRETPPEALLNLKKRLGSENIDSLSPDEYMLNVYKAIAEFTGKRLDDISLDFAEYMYLHDDKVKKLWLPKINANQIFNERHRLK